MNNKCIFHSKYMRFLNLGYRFQLYFEPHTEKSNIYRDKNKTLYVNNFTNKSCRNIIE